MQTARLLMLILFITSLTVGCSGVQSVRLAAGYGPFHAEIEIILRQAEELRQKNGPDCPQAAALERRALELGAVPTSEPTTTNP